MLSFKNVQDGHYEKLNKELINPDLVQPRLFSGYVFYIKQIWFSKSQIISVYILLDLHAASTDTVVLTLKIKALFIFFFPKFGQN